MNAAFIDSLARGLGAKRLKVSLPWEEPPLRQILRKQELVEWVELPDSDDAKKVLSSLFL